MLPPDDATTTWRLPEIPSGGPEAAREVAATCDRLAALLGSTAVTVAQIRQLCATNTGHAGNAINYALTKLQEQHDTAAVNFDRAATTMRRYADELESAQRRHHFSLSGMLKAGAILVGTGAAVVVTVSLAAPAAAAVIGAEVAAAEGAAAAAMAAGESAAAECSALARLFATIRGLSTFSRVQIAYGEVWLGAQAARSEALDNRLFPNTSPQALAMNAASIAVGAGAGKLAELALADRVGTGLTAVGTTGASALGGAVPQSAYDWERTGSFSTRGFAWDAAKGATSSVVSGNSKKLITNFDKWRATHRPSPGRHRAGRHRFPASG